MILRIPELITKEERRRLLLVLPILHAMNKFHNKKKAAEYLGFCPTYIRKTIRVHNELAEFRYSDTELELRHKKKQGELYEKRRRMNRIYP